MTYREDDAATLRRRDDLARAIAADELVDAERDTALAEIAAIDAARIEAARVRLPQLARARIASPCDQPWDTMLGNGAVRSCSRCEKHVFDLSQMTLGQAEALIASRPDGRMCVRLYQRADGTMMFADCEVGARGVVVRKVAVAGAALAIGGAALAWASQPSPTSADTRAPRPSSAEARAAGDAFLDAPERPSTDFTCAMGGCFPQRVGQPLLQDVLALDRPLSSGCPAPPPDTLARVGIGTPLPIRSASDPFDDRLLHRALRARAPAMVARYERELRRHPALAGRIVVRFTVARLGVLTSVQVTENSTGNDELARRTVSLVQTIRLALGPPDGSITYAVPIDFTPPDGHAEASATRRRRPGRR